jgi:hypothetical protein
LCGPNERPDDFSSLIREQRARRELWSDFVMRAADIWRIFWKNA